MKGLNLSTHSFHERCNGLTRIQQWVIRTNLWFRGGESVLNMSVLRIPSVLRMSTCLGSRQYQNGGRHVVSNVEGNPLQSLVALVDDTGIRTDVGPCKQINIEGNGHILYQNTLFWQQISRFRFVILVVCSQIRSPYLRLWWFGPLKRLERKLQKCKQQPILRNPWIPNQLTYFLGTVSKQCSKPTSISIISTLIEVLPCLTTYRTPECHSSIIVRSITTSSSSQSSDMVEASNLRTHTITNFIHPISAPKTQNTEDPLKVNHFRPTPTSNTAFLQNVACLGLQSRLLKTCHGPMGHANWSLASVMGPKEEIGASLGGKIGLCRPCWAKIQKCSNSGPKQPGLGGRILGQNSPILVSHIMYLYRTLMLMSSIGTLLLSHLCSEPPKGIGGLWVSTK